MYKWNSKLNNLWFDHLNDLNVSIIKYIVEKTVRRNIDHISLFIDESLNFDVIECSKKLIIKCEWRLIIHDQIIDELNFIFEHYDLKKWLIIRN